MKKPLKVISIFVYNLLLAAGVIAMVNVAYWIRESKEPKKTSRSVIAFSGEDTLIKFEALTERTSYRNSDYRGVTFLDHNQAVAPIDVYRKRWQSKDIRVVDTIYQPIIIAKHRGRNFRVMLDDNGNE